MTGVQTCALPISLLLQRRLLHRLGKASGLSWLLLLFPFANLLVLLQPSEILKNFVLFILHLLTCICLYLFHCLLIKIQLRMPQQNNQLIGLNGGQLINSSNNNNINGKYNNNGNVHQQLFVHQNGIGNRTNVDQNERMVGKYIMFFNKIIVTLTSTMIF